jgi:hypothetical protein
VPSATLDRLLGALVIAIGATGLVALESGAASAGWVFVGHDLAALVLTAAVVVKVARSVPAAVRHRSFGRLAIGLGLTLVVAGALVGGLAWVASGRLLTFGSLTVLTLHAWAGVVLVPVLAAHLLPRRWRLLRPAPGLRPRLARRTLLRAGLLGFVGGSAYVLSLVSDRALGGSRRFTGSRWLEAGTIPPGTTFIADADPALDAVAWRLRVHGLVATPLELDLASLRALGDDETAAVLDCTSGWAVETAWRGVRVRDVLGAASLLPAARRLLVRSTTGWAAAFDVGEAERLILATGVAGGALPAANGAPCRLVAPDHRGLDWVKWVSEIEIG